MDKTNLMVEFSVIGENFNPDIITKELQIEPTEYYLKGDKSKRNTERKETCWYISTGYVNTLYVSDVLSPILEKLKDKGEKLNDLKNQFDLTYKFFIVVKIENGQVPAIYLDSKVIEFANSVKAEFDFDMYIYS
jgi:hypothetical protein